MGRRTELKKVRFWIVPIIQKPLLKVIHFFSRLGRLRFSETKVICVRLNGIMSERVGLPKAIHIIAFGSYCFAGESFTNL